MFVITGGFSHWYRQISPHTKCSSCTSLNLWMPSYEEYSSHLLHSPGRDKNGLFPTSSHRAVIPTPPGCKTIAEPRKIAAWLCKAAKPEHPPPPFRSCSPSGRILDEEFGYHNLPLLVLHREATVYSGVGPRHGARGLSMGTGLGGGGKQLHNWSGVSVGLWVWLLD